MLMITLRLLLPQAALLRRLILNPLTEENPYLSRPTSILSPPRPVLDIPYLSTHLYLTNRFNPLSLSLYI